MHFSGHAHGRILLCSGIDVHTVHFRPWVRLSLDLKFRTGAVTTVIGGDAGLAAIKAKQRVILPMSEIDDQTLRAMAPKFSAALYAGVHF